MRRLLASLPLAAVLAAVAFTGEAAVDPRPALACGADAGERCPDEIARKDNGEVYTKIGGTERDGTECTTTTTTVSNNGSSEGPVRVGVAVEQSTTTSTETTYRYATYKSPEGRHVTVNCDRLVSV